MASYSHFIYSWLVDISGSENVILPPVALPGASQHRPFWEPSSRILSNRLHKLQVGPWEGHFLKKWKPWKMQVCARGLCFWRRRRIWFISQMLLGAPIMYNSDSLGGNWFVTVTMYIKNYIEKKREASNWEIPEGRQFNLLTNHNNCLPATITKWVFPFST